MTRRFVLSMLGAALCLTWAALTAIAYLRRERPVPAQYPEPDVQPWDQRTVTLAAPGPEWTFSVPQPKSWTI